MVPVTLQPSDDARSAPGTAEALDDLVELGMGFARAKALLSAAELDVFSELAKGPLGPEALSERIGIHRRGARDFFDVLVALGILERDGGLYRNTPAANLYLDRAKPSYIGGRLELWSGLYRTWDRLTESLRTGQPQDAAASAGATLFENLYREPESLRSFLRGMAGGSVILGEAIARRLPWKRYRSVVDVGTAQGALVVQLALAHPHLEGVGFDLPPVQPVFEEYVASFGLTGRLRFEAGDFFADPLPEGEALVMGRILHNWNLEQKRTLLAKAFDALPRGGALIVYGSIIDDERRRNVFGLITSLLMLLLTRGGFDYTAADCRGWMQETGFRQSTVEPLTRHESMIVAIK